MTEPLMLDGRTLARSIEESLRERVAALRQEHDDWVPELATLLVGGDPASATYVKMKINACRRVGLGSRKIVLPESTTTDELLAAIKALNDDPEVTGILLQHPVPKQIDERACFDSITIKKDVDGVTCLGFGRMSMGERAFGSATPAGILRMLDHYNIAFEGKRAVVVGRSPILGKPMAMMLLNRNATVTICHSRTEMLSEIVREADLVVGAVGRPRFIKGDWIKPGAVVVDAGYHPGEGVGDIDLEAAIPRSSAYTPVPGGVGPMTIAMLLTHTVEAAEARDAS